MRCCPITSQAKGYPFEVPLTSASINGVVLADQIKSVDWVTRHAKYAGKASADTVQEVLAKGQTLLSEEQ